MLMLHAVLNVICAYGLGLEVLQLNRPGRDVRVQPEAEWYGQVRNFDCGYDRKDSNYA